MVKCHVSRLSFLILLLVCSPVIATTAPNKNQGSGFYLTWEGGYGKRHTQPMGNGKKSFKFGSNIGAAFGYNINSTLSAEIEFDTQVEAMDSVTDSLPGPLTAEELSHAFMFNAYYHPWLWRQLKPYVGMGVGVGSALYAMHINKIPPPSMQHSRNVYSNIGFQWMGGVSYILAHNLILSLEYRYFDMPTLHYPGRKSYLQFSTGLLKVSYLFKHSSSASAISTIKPLTNMYLSVGSGVNFRQTETFSAGNVKSFHPGPFMALALGRVLNPYFKAEIGLSTHQNDVNLSRVSAGSRSQPSGDEQTFAVMFNTYVAPFGRHLLTPYLGVGAGYAYTTYALHRNLPPNVPGVPPTVFPAFTHHSRGHDGSFTYQGIAGISYPLSTCATLGIEYRYFRPHAIKYHFLNGATAKANASAHILLVRLSYTLNS